MLLYSLKNSLQQVEPHLTGLIPPEAIERIKSVSCLFPDASVSSYGFEYRLDPSALDVDFAINVKKPGQEIIAGLNPHTRLPEAFETHPIWQRISKFCQRTCDPSTLLHHQINDLWLEFDLESDRDVVNDIPPVPGLLFGPNANLAIASDYSWIWEEALPILWEGATNPAVERKLIDCVEKFDRKIRIFQVGLMFSRKVDVIRLCLLGSPLGLLNYLSEIGWQGEIDRLQKIVESLYQYVDGIILSIDIGDRVYPRIGIEGIYHSRYLACVNGQWESLLEYLVSQQLCLPETRDNLLKYSGYELKKQFPQRIYLRGLNHTKLIYQPDRPLEAKIYFGVMHKPLSSILKSNTEQEIVKESTDNFALKISPAPQISPSSSSKTITESINSGINFLLAARDSQGWWKDFDLAAGASDEWVTSYIATMLATISDDQVASATNTAWQLLNTRRNRANGLWGYNRLTPGDADSTGWALQLARALGENNSSRARQALRSLAEHKRLDGGVCTYDTDKAIRAFIHAGVDRSFAGWCSSHTCVSAAIAALPEYRSQLMGYLYSTQESDGSWLPYWWHDPEYATALAAEAIDLNNPDEKHLAVNQALTWAIKRLEGQGFASTSHRPSGSPFATAWCLRLLLLGKSYLIVREPIEKATKWLVQQQQADGSWVSSARLRVPLPEDLNPDQFDRWIYHGKIEGSIALDRQNVFTTATVVNALHRSLIFENSNESSK